MSFYSRPLPLRLRYTTTTNGDTMTTAIGINCPRCGHDVVAHAPGLHCIACGHEKKARRRKDLCRLAPSAIARKLLAGEPTEAQIEAASQIANLEAHRAALKAARGLA